MKAILVLEDGTSFEGTSMGAAGERMGPVVFSTGVVGYQELATDPANAGKIVVLTYPLIGNYGVAAKFNESAKGRAAALVIKEASRITSNWQAEGPLDKFLKDEGIIGLNEVDTRTLAVKLRDDGEMMGIVSTGKVAKAPLLKKLKAQAKAFQPDFIAGISTKRPKKLKGKAGGAKLGVIDLGATNSLLWQLKELGCNVTLLPHRTTVDKVLADKFDGVIVSNGPENDVALPAAAQTVAGLIGKVPLLGISTGHQVICLALGGSLKKMKVGHHGVNCPVIAPSETKGEITAQNHSMVLDDASLSDRKDVKVTLRHLNDDTVEEIGSSSLKLLATQYIPACPGCGEVHPVFERFLKLTMKGR